MTWPIMTSPSGRRSGEFAQSLKYSRFLLDGSWTGANGVYVVNREDEVADGKHPDIRLSVANGDLKAVVEVKIADNWTLTDLERALRKQLVGQYLRHASCRAGCLLLTYHGRKPYWYWKQSETRKRTMFPELVALLNDNAQDIEKASTRGIRIAVFGLDLTDPPLPGTRPEGT